MENRQIWWASRHRVRRRRVEWVNSIQTPEGRFIDAPTATDEEITLMAAAPELLYELKALVVAAEKEAAEAGETETPWLDSARAAISKAEGTDDE